MRVPQGRAPLSRDEKLARIKAVCEWFDALGVKVDENRIKAFCRATEWIPWQQGGLFYFQHALDKLVRGKRDGYNTAPQPGEVWKAFESLIPSRLWGYSPTQGSMPPRFFSACTRAQLRLGSPEPLSLPTPQDRPQDDDLTKTGPTGPPEVTS